MLVISHFAILLIFRIKEVDNNLKFGHKKEGKIESLIASKLGKRHLGETWRKGDEGNLKIKENKNVNVSIHQLPITYLPTVLNTPGVLKILVPNSFSHPQSVNLPQFW